jgi:hypothetical protein
MQDDTFFPDLFVPWEEITPGEIAAFESALNGARDERDMQRFLENHPRMLIQQISGGRGAWVIPQKRLGSEHVTDFLIAQKASDGFVWYAVELERPQAKIFTKKGDPSTTLNHALRQVSDWRDWLSHNRDYAIRPREQSGLGLIEIDPELEGLVIMGRDADIDQSTIARRRRLMRELRVKIESYDWLLYQARERLAAREDRIGPDIRDLQNSVSAIRAHMSAVKAALSAPEHAIEELFRHQTPEKAIIEVFGRIFSTNSAVRETDGEDVDLRPDYPDVKVPLQIVYRKGVQGKISLQLHEWIDWIEHVQRDLFARHSLLVTEIAPVDDLQERLTLEQDGVWQAPQWFRRSGDQEPSFVRLDVLVYLPPAMSDDDKRSRVATGREVLLRRIAWERDRGCLGGILSSDSALWLQVLQVRRA